MIASRTTGRAKNRDGFTLVEVLVTLVLIALLVGVVLPSVIRQLDRGEPVRVTEDLEAVRSAARLFRVDVRRWPGTLEQLMVESSGVGGWHLADDADPVNFDINNTTIPEGLRNRWNGPYLEVGSLTVDKDLLIGSEELAKAISELIDGHEVVSPADANAGRVRYDNDILTYLLSPIN